MTSIRRASVADARRIAEIHVRAWQVAYRGIMLDRVLDGLSVDQRESVWKENLAKQGELGRATFVVADEGITTGWATVGPNRDKDVDLACVFELYGIYLDPAHWDKKHGYALISHAHDWVRGWKRWNEITLWVLEANARAREFYERVGYRADGGTKMWQKEGAPPLRELRYRMGL